MLIELQVAAEKKRINKLVQYNFSSLNRRLHTKQTYHCALDFCLHGNREEFSLVTEFRCICEIDYNPTSRLKIRLKFDFPVKMKVVTSQCRIAPKIHDPLPFWPMGARTTTCRLYHGSIRIVMLKFLSKILYLHPLKIQKLLYDLIACKQLPTTVYVIESCMLTPAVAQYGAI